MNAPTTFDGKSLHYDDALTSRLQALDDAIRSRWDDGSPSVEMQREWYERTRLDEIYHSNRIEGNRLSYSETRQVIQDGAVVPGLPAIERQEARNLSKALDFAQAIAFDWSRAVTQIVARQFHALLMDGIEPDAGRYRKTEIIIRGSAHATPEAFLVPQLMTELSDYLAEVTSMGAQSTEIPIFRAAATHALFVQIHPFTDGNGRTARALMNLILRRSGYPPSIIPEHDRARYIDALERTWDRGDLSMLLQLIHEYAEQQYEREQGVARRNRRRPAHKPNGWGAQRDFGA